MLTYALINAQAEDLPELMKKLKALSPNIRKAHIIWGEYDIIASIKASSINELRNLMGKIKSFEGIKQIRYLPVADKTKQEDSTPHSREIIELI